MLFILFCLVSHEERATPRVAAYSLGRMRRVLDSNGLQAKLLQQQQQQYPATASPDAATAQKNCKGADFQRQVVGGLSTTDATASEQVIQCAESLDS